MKILEAIRNRSTSAGGGDAHSADPDSVDEHQLPIARYDHLDERKITAQLDQLTQVELAAVESYERSHEERAVILNKLHYLRGSEPLPGYDTLAPEEIARALEGADAERVKAVRDYERKFQDRPEVLKELARVLPDAPESAGHKRSREEKAERTRTATKPGF